MATWSELVRGLGQALLDVLKAEIRGLETEVQRSGEELQKGVGLLAAAVALLFWTVGALIFAAAAVLAIWLPLWGAALIVAAVFGLAGGLLIHFGLGRLRKFENPLRTARRRFEDHMDWVQGRLLATEPPLSPAGASRSGDSGEYRAADLDDVDEMHDFRNGPR